MPIFCFGILCFLAFTAGISDTVNKSKRANRQTPPDDPITDIALIEASQQMDENPTVQTFRNIALLDDLDQ